jgi:uncharacterized membrane protein HdeD (DUF308 family)
MESSLIGGLRHVVARHWWVLLLRGIVAIVLGLMAFLVPGITLASLILLIGVCCFADGIAAIAGGLRGHFWQSTFMGVVSILAGLATFFYPGLTAMVLLYVIAFWAIARGILDIIAAIEFRKVIEGELLLGLAGLLSIAFGVFIVLNPGAGALSIVWLLGAYAFVFGITLVILGFRVKSLA